MLLAGGQGSRLYALTRKVAKPAVSFGGKYKIIDFTLSNCTNSDIDTVGVLTQYQPLQLNDYVGNGLPWDLDRISGGVKILPPYQGKDGADWYKGTANAIYQNLGFIDLYDPDYVLVLSGDHIYKMDYAKMLSAHKKSGAGCTIAVFEVPIEEASRFGIMTTDDEGRIVKFSEKPANPDSTKASMGIYIFNRHLLESYLKEDANDPDSVNDFGKNIIPKMLGAGEKMMAYKMEGYWKDVGTISSLWEANMDLLGKNPALCLDDDFWRIYSRHITEAPQMLGKTAKVTNSSITEGCVINGSVENSVLGVGVTVEEGAIVKNSVLMDYTYVCSGASVNYTITDANVFIGKNSVVGSDTKDDGIALIGANVKIAENEKIQGGAMIENTEEEEA